MDLCIKLYDRFLLKIYTQVKWKKMKVEWKRVARLPHSNCIFPNVKRVIHFLDYLYRNLIIVNETFHIQRWKLFTQA